LASSDFDPHQKDEIKQIKHTYRGITLNEYFEILQEENMYPTRKNEINLDIKQLYNEISRLT
jgi:hypothetical protein